MKKVNLLVIGFVFFIFTNLLVTNYSFETSNFDFNSISSQNLAFAQGEGSGGGGSFNCYSVMSQNIGSRALECNTPCCYKQDYTGTTVGNQCSGSFTNC